MQSMAQKNHTEEEFIKRERIEYDAVHPRFAEPRSQEAIEEFQIAHDFYCDQCKLFFAPSVDGLNFHFKEHNIKHVPVDRCFYCNGNVFTYSFNKERKLYHNCKDNKL